MLTNWTYRKDQFSCCGYDQRNFYQLLFLLGKTIISIASNGFFVQGWDFSNKLPIKCSQHICMFPITKDFQILRIYKRFMFIVLIFSYFNLFVKHSLIKNANKLAVLHSIKTSKYFDIYNVFARFEQLIKPKVEIFYH